MVHSPNIHDEKPARPFQHVAMAALMMVLAVGGLAMSASRAEAQSKLPPCPSDQSVLWHNCFGTYTAPNGDKHVSEFKDDKQNGQGVSTYANGDKYVGGWKDGRQNGQGTYTWANGNKYVGGWKDARHNGQGTYTFASGFNKGGKYVGEFKDGKQNGQGTYTFADGKKYVGEFKDGVPKDPAASVAFRADAKLRQTAWAAAFKNGEENMTDNEIAVWEKYSKREKTLLEKVFNYSSVGDENAEWAMFWVSGENNTNKCILTRYINPEGTIKVLMKTGNLEAATAMRLAGSGYEKSFGSSTVDVREINENGFKIKESKINVPMMGTGSRFVFGDEKISFNAPKATQVMARLQKAWGLAFQQCPGKKSAF